MIIVTGLFTVTAENRAEVVTVMMKAAKTARQAEGCITCAFCADLENMNAIRLYEEWESEEAHQEALNNPDFPAIGEVINANNVKWEGGVYAATPHSDDG